MTIAQELAPMATVGAGILMILIIVTVHELGHLIVARACGVGVEGFSVGFGPGFKMFTLRGIPFTSALFRSAVSCR